MIMNCILASSTQWPLSAFLKKRLKLPGQWVIVTTPEDLKKHIFNVEEGNAGCPDYIFFPHWSHIVPESILEYDCVGFHMSNLPYGRGGSPLQHVIASGAKWTPVVAFKMTKELDAGPIYHRQNMSLEGSAKDCYMRAAEITMDMIEWIVANEPTPAPQVGEAHMFKRRKPEESALPTEVSLEQLYNHIRMLDADGYPKAFLDWGRYRFEFHDADYDYAEEDGVDAKVRISLRSAS